MQDVLRAFYLAFAGMFHPRILWLSVRPFLIAGLIWTFALWFGWDWLLDELRMLTTESSWAISIQAFLDSIGWEGARAVISPFFAAVIVMPLIITSLLVIVSFTSISGIVKHIEKQKYYQGMRQLNGGTLWGSFFYSIWSTVVCIFLMLITMPIWWVPPLFSILPPLIWGWLTMRLMSYDVLARHASGEEREYLLESHRLPLISMGVIAGLMGAVPSFFWVSSIVMLVLFPIISLIMMWMYSFVFLFAGLWFAHYLLFALRVSRQVKGELI